jgi:glycosyltransferase involved in cell wall biosynthesis
MTQVPKISIVTPSFNQARFVESTLISVIEQDYPNLEYVVIDGGSSDGSVEIIEKYSEHLHYWVSEPDEGHGHALNKGFARTSGEIMAWINSDDKYLPWTFRTAAEIFSTFPEVNWICGLHSAWNDQGAMVKVQKRPKNVYDFLLGNFRSIQQESVFWRRSLWEKSGGYINQDYRFMVDGELWTRFFLSDQLFSVDCVLGGFRSYESNRSKLNFETCTVEMQRAIGLMQANCCEEVLENWRKLKLIQGLKRNPILRYLPVERVARNKTCTKLYESIRYDSITYKSGRWVKVNSPFYVY